MLKMMRRIKDLAKPKDEVNLLLAALEDKIAGRIEQDELEGIALRWSYHYALKEYEYKAPPVPTARIEEFNRMTDFKKKAILEKDGDMKFKVMKHRSEVVASKYRNKNNKAWLKKMSEFFKGKNEMDKVKEIERSLFTYEQA
jgi:hypothetical protein